MNPITIQAIVNAPIQQVRDKRNNPADIMQRNYAWDDRHCPASTNDLQVGGKFCATMAAKDGSMSFDYSGYYTLIENLSKLEYTLGEFPKHNVPAGRKVSVLFESIDDNTTKVTETFDPENENPIEMQQAWRQMILDNFKKHAEKSEEINDSTW